MTLNTNIAPYFNDFDESLNFHQILFKPGMAVQARELTQLQNILQTQTKRFGDSVYKEGALVSGGAQFVEPVTYIKIASHTMVNVKDAIGKFAVTPDGSVYRIKDVIEIEGSDPLTIYCTPVTNNSGAKITLFASDVLSIRPVYADLGDIGTMTVAATAFTGQSMYFNVAEGVYYTNGFFVRSPEKFICLSKYTTNPTKMVGFEVQESIVDYTNSAMGGDTLLDPAQGSYNYAAPGADRYRIDLNLKVFDIADVSTPITTSNTFIELNRIVDGQVSRKHYGNQFSLLGDTMARRTYDESGDYVVTDFKFKLATSSYDDSFDGVIQPGKAYVKGYEVETLVPQKIRIPKARTTSSETGYDIPVYYGNFFIISGLVGNTTASMFSVSTMETVTLYSSTTPSASNSVGTARVKSIEYVSGTGVSAIYKLFVTDVRATGNMLSIKQVANNAWNTYTIKGNIDASGTSNILANTSFTSGTSSIIVSAPASIYKGMLVSGTGIAANTTVTSVSSSSIGLSAATTGTSSGTVTFSATNLYDSNYDSAIFRIPHSNIASVSNINYATRRNIDVTIVSGNGTASLSVSGERFKDVSSTTNLNRHYIAIVKSKTAGALTVGTILALTYSGSPTITLNVGSTNLTLATGDATFNGVVQLVATIDITNVPRKTKTISVSPKSKTLGYNLWVAGTTYSLGYADVNRIIGVYESPASGTPATTAHTNITSKFELNKNYKDSFYDHSTIKLKSGQTAPVNPILIQFEVLEHSSGHGFFSADSYPDYDAIPSYTDKLGKVYELTDCIDFRQKRVDDASATLAAYNATATLVDQQNIDTIYNFADANYSYYLSRIDKVILQKDGNLAVISGTPALVSPQEPNDSDTGMTLAVLNIPAYTKSVGSVVTTLVRNRRYTMKDVGKLDDRIARLEYYSTLNELEKEIVNTTFTTQANESLFNSGFIVDIFRGHGIGNVTHPDYKCSIDFKNRVLRPSFKANAAQWILSGGTNTLGYVSKKKFAMLPLNVTTPEVTLIDQSIASSVKSINPFNIQSFVGTLTLLPDRDIWYNTVARPDIITNEANDAAAVQAGKSAGTNWGEWVLVSSSTVNGTTTKNYSRTGEETYVTQKTVVRSSTTDTVETTFDYRMRDQDIEFVVDGLRPNTEIQVFFDGVNITAGFCKQYNSTTGLYDILIPKTDAKGSARGIIMVRDNLFTTFSTGKKLVQISTGYINPLVTTTYAEATYYSEGKNTVTQTSKVMGVDYGVAKRSVTGTKTDSVYSPPVNNDDGTVSTTGDAVKVYSGGNLKVTTSSTSLFAQAGAVAGANSGAATNSQYVAVLTGVNTADLYTGNPDNGSTGQTMGQVLNLSYNRLAAGDAGGLTLSPTQSVSKAESVLNSLASLSPPLSAIEAATVATIAANATQSAAEITALAIATREKNGGVVTGVKADGTSCINRDPTAQTFFIDGDNPDGVFISSIDTFFSRKDQTGTIPVRLEIRPTVNGYPDSYKVIPGSVVVKQPSQINLPSNENSPVSTTWTFDNPVHLPPGEYAFVLLSDSSDYFVYVAEMGKNRLGTNQKIAAQPTLGSYFASQNATTWTADQNVDVMFRLKRASFRTDFEYSVELSLEKAKDSYANPIDVVFDSYNLNADYGFYAGKNAIKFEVSTKNMSDVMSSYTEIIPGNDIFPGYRSKHYTTGDTKLRISMSTTDEKLSPYAEVFPSGFIMVENIINNGDVGFPDTLPLGSGSTAVYMTKPYTLEDGFDASSARVMLVENIPSGASIEVYMRGLSRNDASDIQTLDWIRMTRKTPARVPANFYEYYDSEYFIDDFTYTNNGSTYETYRAVMFKVVMKTTDTARSPSAKKFRAIALA